MRGILEVFREKLGVGIQLDLDLLPLGIGIGEIPALEGIAHFGAGILERAGLIGKGLEKFLPDTLF